MTGSPGLRERKKQQTRQAIQQAAFRLFAERGFDGVTVAEIATVADVSAATVFNYFPAKEDLVYAGMEDFDIALIEAIRARAPGEPVLAAFRRFVLEIGGLLASPDAEDTRRLTVSSRIVTTSPALLARERQVFAQYTQSLSALIAEETRAATDDITPWVAANALMGVHRALLNLVRGRILTGTPSARVGREARSYGERALRLLEDGLGSYAIKAESP